MPKRRLTRREANVARCLYRLMFMTEGIYEMPPDIKALPKDEKEELARIAIALCDLWDALKGGDDE